LGPPFRVERLAATECPQQLIYLALHNDYSEDFNPTTTLDEAECGKIVVDRLLKGNRGHWGVLEHPHLSLILQADHNTIMQLRTHRVGVSFDVQSMRYSGTRIQKVATGEIPPEQVFYTRPVGDYHDRDGKRYSWTEADQQQALEWAKRSAVRYHQLRQQGVVEEDARGALVTSYFQNAVVTGNARSWLHLLDVRLKGNAQDEVRELMKLVALQVQRWIPETYAWYKEHRESKAILAP